MGLSAGGIIREEGGLYDVQRKVRGQRISKLSFHYLVSLLPLPTLSLPLYRYIIHHVRDYTSIS